MDIVPLWEARGLADQLPYLEAQNEYPVLTGLVMALAAWPAKDSESFFHITAALLAAAGLATAMLLVRATGRRALFFACSASVVAYAFINWDLLAVFLATAGTVAYLRGNDRLAGIGLGLGAAAKLYPAFLVLPFILDRLPDANGRARARRLATSAAVAWLSVNLPVAALAPDGWSRFYVFNSARSPDWDSLWYLASRHLGNELPVAAVNVLSLAAFVGATWLVWSIKKRRYPEVPAWTLGFPLIAIFLLTNKVYSPQYGLWLLPWFALTLPRVRLFILFQAAEVAVFLTRFHWLGRYRGYASGWPFEWFEVAILARGVVLTACIIAWIGAAPAEAAEKRHEVPARSA